MKDINKIRKLRAKLLALGQPIMIPKRELPQPNMGAESPPKDIVIYPYPFGVKPSSGASIE